MIDRATAELLLINRAGGKMSAAEMDGTTVTGSNQDLNDALLVALLAMGITPASLSAISDDDLAGLDDADIRQFLDRAELRVLETVLGRLVTVDISVGPRRESLSQLATQVEKSVDRLIAKIAAEYGGGVGALEAGTIGLDFAQHYETGDGDA